MSLGLDPMSNINTNFLSDFDFSSNNQYIASSSLDKTIRVWELSRGVCIRVIYGISPHYCIRFHPVILMFFIIFFFFFFFLSKMFFIIYIFLPCNNLQLFVLIVKVVSYKILSADGFCCFLLLLH
jgi:WD40 repeat protein